MTESISETISRFYSLIKDYKEGAPDTRYKSWEWCHKAFVDNKDLLKDPELTDEIENKIDYLALHLAFYLASWGMYRGSSELLQRDYKVHKKVVRDILNQTYRDLWDYSPQSNDNIEKANNLLLNKKTGIYWKIKDDYKSLAKTKSDGFPSETLVTKILMGTFGCVPAFDRFFKDGLKVYQARNGEINVGGYEPTRSIETGETFKALTTFAIENKDELRIDGSDILYPPMKCVDMFFWQIGYEKNLSDAINKSEGKTREKLIKKAERLGLV